MSEILVLGSLNADLVVTATRAPQGGETVAGERFEVFHGGKGANQAFAAARLGGAVSMLGRVGQDEYGVALREGLRSVGVDVERVRCIEKTGTGVAAITVDGDGQNRIVVVPGANGAYTSGELERDRDAFSAARFALFQLETPLETVAEGLRRARQGGCVTILDPAPARALDDSMLSLVDYLTPNQSELRALLGRSQEESPPMDEVIAMARSLIARGVGKVVVKLGEAGACLVGADLVVRRQARSVRVVDTTAAGDCFNAAFAVALSRGQDEAAALRFACDAASLSVTRHGAQASMPTFEEASGFSISS
ncbi:ribokinase [Pelagicoccus sp. SDUM812003]|uniref:ribokinase n=1 Tax=Pelagicoccus sp. SDUM812003 TaxID=3041267 RepID=UPI00280D8E00|nr:ribokinase [Pelagicoccus sp. SDUM812003]MDQ8205243.1 ribokinase [Pelagicoccus sp. SDUM812003]